MTGARCLSEHTVDGHAAGKVGTTIGRYLVRQVLGAGAMGVVYSAYDPELDRHVAIKLVHERAQGPDPAREDRLRREAKAMARLVHPNVVHVYDVGAHCDRTFIAMELIEGQTLAQWLAETRRSTNAVLACFLAAGRGLSAAHEAGLLHRDFKPENVLVARDGRVVVGDFGLAREVARAEVPGEAEAEGPQRHSASGRLGGTPAYLAPEVIAGGEPCAASDQFSFCVSVWEGLCGARPFSGRTLSETLEQIRSRKVAPPPRRMPAALRRALLRGLEPDPLSRHPSMAALLEELDRTPRRVRFALAMSLSAGVVCLGALAVRTSATAICSSAAAQLEPAWSEPRRTALAAAFTAGAQGAAWPAIDRALERFARSWMDVHTRSCTATYTRGEQSEEAHGRRARCLGEQREVVAALGDLWLKAPPELLAKASSALQSLPLPAACDGDAPLKAARMAEPGPAVAARAAALRRRLSAVKARLAAADAQSALALARVALVEAKNLRYAPVEAEALLALATALRYHGDFAQAERTLQDAALAAVAADHEQALAEVMVLLASAVVFDRGRLDDGEVLISRAQPVVARLGDRRLSTELDVARAHVKYERGDVAGAHAILSAVLPQLEALFGKDHYEVARVRGHLFQSASDLGRSAEARAHAGEALQILERTLPPDHVYLYPALMNRAICEYDLGDLPAARRLFARALRVAERAQGPDGPGVAAALANLATVDRVDGASASARSAAERALRIAVQARGPEHPLTGFVESVVGQLSWEEGDLDEALAHLGRALERREKRYGRVHVDTAEALSAVGRARLDAGHADGLGLVLEADAIVRGLHASSARREQVARAACEALLEDKRPREAGPHCERTLDAALEGRGEDHPLVINARRLLAERALLSGKVPDRAALERGLAALQARGGWARVTAEVQFTLARTLAAGTDPAGHVRAVALARSALATAHRIGMRRARLAPMERTVEGSVRRVAQRVRRKT